MGLSETKQHRKQFFPEIETLRAIAVLMVLVSHFIPTESEYYVPYMWYGVQLFFTISGFLITYILIGNIQSGDLTRKKIIKNFFIRRILRLFPIYYLFVIAFFILRNVFSIYIWKNEYNWYFFTYLQNMYFFNQGALNSSFSHLWSLGVEEQFYLVWPFILVFFNKKRLPLLFSTFISISIFTMVAFSHVPEIGVLTSSNLHTLGIGALIAYFYFYKLDSNLYHKVLKYRYIALLISLSGLLFTLTIGINSLRTNILFREIFLMLTSGLIVFNSIVGWPNNLNFFFKSKVLMQIGKISYGIYLYHWVIPPVLAIIIGKVSFLAFLQQENIFLNFILLTSYSILVAYLSFYLIEIRFLKLKERFKS